VINSPVMKTLRIRRCSFLNTVFDRLMGRDSYFYQI